LVLPRSRARESRGAGSVNQTVVTILRVFAVLIAVVLTILLGMQGYVDWQGTDRDPFANDPSKMWSFISMLARIGIGLALVVAAAFVGPTTRHAA
jgi:hypothetical protein